MRSCNLEILFFYLYNWEKMGKINYFLWALRLFEVHVHCTLMIDVRRSPLSRTHAMNLVVGGPKWKCEKLYGIPWVSIGILQ